MTKYRPLVIGVAASGCATVPLTEYIPPALVPPPPPMQNQSMANCALTPPQIIVRANVRIERAPFMMQDIDQSWIVAF
jgi:hypothetical protein